MKVNASSQYSSPLAQMQSVSGPFRIAAIGESNCTLAAYNRRDFYKISLVLSGSSQLLYAARGIEINRPALVFTSPLVPYSWEATGSVTSCGYFCVLTEAFLQMGGPMKSLQESSLFKAGGDPVYFLDDDQLNYLRSVFIRMQEDYASEYIYKYELIRSQVNLLIHEAIKMQPAIAYFTPPNAAARITQLFLRLLENQFPVESPRQGLLLKKAGDYANQLSVHVNHLNAALHEVTGKSTTTHLNERMVMEAKSLLLHTDWSVAQIADSLGFEYASYFNRFFKKYTGVTPLSLRKNL